MLATMIHNLYNIIISVIINNMNKINILSVVLWALFIYGVFYGACYLVVNIIK